MISYRWSFGTKHISNGFRGIQRECDAMPLNDMILNDLDAKVKVIHFDTNRFLLLPI